MAITGYSSGASMMMQLGDFQFGIQTAAYQELERATEWRWPSQDRFGQAPVLQYVGPAGDTITLPGVIFPEWRGGIGQVDAMRAEAAKGTPLSLIDGRGNAMGTWVIERVAEKQAVFAAAGVPRRQEFTLSLRRYAETAPGGLVAVATSAITVPGIAIPAGASGAVGQLQGLAGSVIASAKSLQASAQSVLAKVQFACVPQITPYAVMAANAACGALRVVSVASDLQTNANRALKLVGAKPINLTAISAARSMSGQALSLVTTANSAATLLRRTMSNLEQLGGVATGAVQSVRAAAVVAERAAALARDTNTEAGRITG